MGRKCSVWRKDVSNRMLPILKCAEFKEEFSRKSRDSEVICLISKYEMNDWIIFFVNLK